MQNFSSSRCSNRFKPMKEFSKLKFMGKWYEVQRSVFFDFF